MHQIIILGKLENSIVMNWLSIFIELKIWGTYLCDFARLLLHPQLTLSTCITCYSTHISYWFAYVSYYSVHIFFRYLMSPTTSPITFVVSTLLIKYNKTYIGWSA